MMAVEVALNQKSSGVEKHLKRFDNYYSDYKENGYVFHIQTNTRDKLPILGMRPPYDTDDAKNRVYTYIKHQNALYRGSNVVKRGVSKYLPSRLFCTSILRSVLK